jgi:DNA-binding transcriptional regulator PaaX
LTKKSICINVCVILIKVEKVVIEKTDFKSKYPIPLANAVIFPFVYRIWNSHADLPDVKPKCILNFCLYTGYNEGAARTAITRLKQKGTIISADENQKSGYILNESNRIRTMQIKENTIQHGFTLAVFSFNREDEKERYVIRSILARTGFKKLAQNTYINVRGRKNELLLKIKKEGLEKHLFIFECEEDLDVNTISRLIDIWDLKRRKLVLDEFLNDLKIFITPDGLSGEDMFHMIGYAGSVYSAVFQRTEPPVPEKHLPPDYPLKKILKFLMDKNREFFSKTKKYYIKINIYNMKKHDFKNEVRQIY